ncbi:hypothetical protein [Mycobacterium sp. 050134]|uniref:hypothetical protein n=1 Tax=Mycobacterium sp. 050134 TaxID=3096111 RepID=UPI002ED96A8F
MVQTDLPGLTASKALALAQTWTDGGLWNDVLWLARRCWQIDEPTALALRWHHLVLAVGNFKRQRGRRLHPSRIDDIEQPVPVLGERFTLPSGLVVERESQSSWQQLKSALPGAGLATTTALLAALWPEHHFVFDWRVHSAADALRIHAHLAPSPSTELEMEGRRGVAEDFTDYATVRGWLGTIACPLVVCERALYRLSQKVPSVEGRSWMDYASEIASKLECVDL